MTSLTQIALIILGLWLTMSASANGHKLLFIFGTIVFMVGLEWRYRDRSR